MTLNPRNRYRHILSTTSLVVAVALSSGDVLPEVYGFVSSCQKTSHHKHFTGAFTTDCSKYLGWSNDHSPISSMTLGATDTAVVVDSSLDASTRDVDSLLISNSDKPIGTIIFLVPSDTERRTKFGIHSPVDSPSYAQAATHLSSKATWFSEDRVGTAVLTVDDVRNGDAISTLLQSANILIAMGLTSEEDMDVVEGLFETRRSQNREERYSMCHFALDCARDLPPMVGPYDDQSGGWNPSLIFPWSDTSSGRRFCQQMQGLFDRWTSDDFTVALMLFLNRFSGHTVAWVKDSADATWEKGPIRNIKEFYGMTTKCGDCLVDCLKDEKCKACLDALTQLDTRDQAASYRTIVSYESEQLKDFSFCVFQKNNIFQCQATIPTMPTVTPMQTWRGKPLTQEMARSLLVGHLDDDDAPQGSERTNVSWKVACGANVAYDQFPSQNQLFYAAAKGKDMWYDPVFRVETLDGRHVWCKRHYRVRNGPTVGTFRLSVLDNGVTSDEFWTILGAADDLSWIAFHYAGAAKTVGQRYLGGLLCTANGGLPYTEDSINNEEIWDVFRMAGIEPWELFIVNNDPTSEGAIAAGPPPLDIYRKEVLTSKLKLI